MWPLFLTVTLSNDVEVKVRIFGVERVERLKHGPKFSTNGSLVGNVAERVSDVRETSTRWLVNEQQVSKGVPT